jgi:2-furoyl-CoA dehydrogenase FAD binding subunit
MKPARFDYLRAGTLAEAHAMLAAEGEDARIIAGGQSLVPMLSMRLARPKLLVDIMHLPELAKIGDDGNIIRIGAGVRQAELLAWPQIHDRMPLFGAALPWVGHAQTRSRGTARTARPQRRRPIVVAAKAAARSGSGFLYRADVDGAQR